MMSSVYTHIFFKNNEMSVVVIILCLYLAVP